MDGLLILLFTPSDMRLSKKILWSQKKKHRHGGAIGFNSYFGGIWLCQESQTSLPWRFCAHRRANKKSCRKKKSNTTPWWWILVVSFVQVRFSISEFYFSPGDDWVVFTRRFSLDACLVRKVKNTYLGALCFITDCMFPGPKENIATARLWI